MIYVIANSVTFRGDHTSSVNELIVRDESMVLPSHDGFAIDGESRAMEMEMEEGSELTVCTTN